jgi:RsiW-degrading membrane proteinase PrsW (M82 family)
MSEEWFYLEGGSQKGPVGPDALRKLVHEGALLRSSLIWREGMAVWTPAGDSQPALFEDEDWFYMDGGLQKGPVSRERLVLLVGEGSISREAHIWKPGMHEWERASGLAVPSGTPKAPAVPPPPPPTARPESRTDRGFLGGIGAKISEYTDLPTISNVPVREILMGGLDRRLKPETIEEEFAVGTERATPELRSIPGGWPSPRAFWRIFFGALATYGLLYWGAAQDANPNDIPGMVVIGSFLVPFAVVILFFELNTPRNVSLYQVAKMFLLGGALSLIATDFAYRIIPGADAGALIPSMLVGVCEETGKAVALLILIRSPRYRWQLNGLLFGAAVGAGFAGFESAGYAFTRGLDLFVKALVTFLRQGDQQAVTHAFGLGLDRAISVITLRGILAPGGHVLWTAMVGSALWKAKGRKPFTFGMLFDKVVVRRWLTAVVLHGLWDADLPLVNVWLKCLVLIVVGWYIVFAIVKQALGEIEAAKEESVLQTLATPIP